MKPQELLDATLEKARRASVGGRVDPSTAARNAVVEAKRNAQTARQRRERFWLGAAAGAAALVLVGVVTYASLPAEPTRRAHARPAAESALDPSTPSEDETPARLRLSSGDLLYGSTGARFEVPEAGNTRLVELEFGDMLFDVVHREGERFAVRAGEVEIEVLGTVFSVLHEGDIVAVRVFDGLVAVRRGTEVHRIGAGEMWASGDAPNLDAWRARSDDQWRALAPSGAREEGRGAPHESAEGLAAPPREGERAAQSAQTAPLAEGRRLLRTGNFEALLALPHDGSGPWLLLRGDALRALQRGAEAAGAYERAASLLQGARRVQAAFAAAQLRARTAPESALAIVANFGLAREGSALEERARSLRIRVLRRLRRMDALDAEIEAYERRFGPLP